MSVYRGLNPQCVLEDKASPSHHEAGFTKLQFHQIGEPRSCKRMLVFEGTALCLSTMLSETPCGREKVVHYTCLLARGAAK